MSGHQPLAGKSFIVTGAATGMGAATVVAYAQAGASVVGWYRNRGGDEVLAGLSAAERERVSFRHCDVADEGDVAQATGEAVERLGGLDRLVHAAAILGTGQPAEGVPLDE